MAFGAQFVGTLNANQEQVFKTLPVANGVTVTKGDFVYMASGRVSSATIAGARLTGVAQSTVIGNSGGTNKVLVDVTRNGLYAVDNDNVGTTFAASHVGQYIDLTGATGAQLADTSTVSTSSNQLLVWEFNPDIIPTLNDSDDSIGVFSIAENAQSI